MMSDKNFYEALDRQINNLMQGAKYIVIEDLAELNDVCMELTRRMKQVQQQVIQDLKNCNN